MWRDPLIVQDKVHGVGTVACVSELRYPFGGNVEAVRPLKEVLDFVNLGGHIDAARSLKKAMDEVTRAKDV